MNGRELSIAILTCSDRCFAGKAINTGGLAVAAAAVRILAGRVVAEGCVPDDKAAIVKQLRQWTCPESAVVPDIIFTTGGTGLALRDVTPEATLAVLDRRCAGIMEIARMRCMGNNPRACLSRGEAGTVGRQLIINLPGSPRGAVEVLEALADILPHALGVLHGQDNHSDNRPAPPPAELK